jgi:hypothetical protein
MPRQKHEEEFMGKTAVCLFLACVLVASGCGYAGSASYGAGMGMNPPATMMFNAMLNTGDAVNDQILKFEITVSSATLTGVSPTPTTANLLSKPAEVEFVHEAGTFEPLAAINLPAGTYSGATFTISNPEVVVLNAGAPISVPVTLTSTTVTAVFNPAITIMNTSIASINFDLDLAASVILNGTPVTSATVNPIFNVTSLVVAAKAEQDDDNGEIEDVHGTITSIAPPIFTIQTSQAMLSFITDMNTEFKDGIAQLSDLKVGDVVEVDGVTNPDGTKYASKVAKDGGSTGEEVEGIITAVTGSPATAISIADQLDSSDSATPPMTVDVAVNSSTVFTVRADKLNSISLPLFDASHIGKGQRVEADSATAGFPTLATGVKLREQALVGTVATVPPASPSSFTLNLSPTSAFAILSGATSVAVTVPNDVTLKVAPTAGATLLIRGLVFVNGTTYTMVGIRGEQD